MVELGYAPFLPKHTLDVSPDLGIDSEEKGPSLVGRHCTNVFTESVNPGAAESLPRQFYQGRCWGRWKML